MCHCSRRSQHMVLNGAVHHAAWCQLLVGVMSCSLNTSVHIMLQFTHSSVRQKDCSQAGSPHTHPFSVRSPHCRPVISKLTYGWCSATHQGNILSLTDLIHMWYSPHLYTLHCRMKALSEKPLLPQSHRRHCCIRPLHEQLLNCCIYSVLLCIWHCRAQAPVG